MKLSLPALMLIGITSYTGILLAATGAVFPERLPVEPFRSGPEFCEGLRYQLQADYVAGLITAEQADDLLIRCLNSYS